MTAGGDTRADRGWLRILVAAAVLAAAALLAALAGGVQVEALGAWRDGQVTWLALLAGVFVSACLIWPRVFAGGRRASALGGAAAGVLTAILAYPVTLLLTKLGPLAVAGPHRIAEHVVAALELAGLLLVGTGFAATIVLGLVGMPLAVLLRTKDADGRRESRPGRLAGTVAGALVLVLGAAFAVLSAIPVDMNGLDVPPPPTPALDHDGAMAAFSGIAAEEAGLDLDQRCLSSLLTHGRKVAVVVVYLHGFTNCPHQFDVLGKELYALGYNVYVPRLPLHGFADRMTDAHKDTTAENLVGATNEAIDIARGLGDKVVLTGLSGGASASMWAAQNRPEVARSISMAPFLTLYSMPWWANRPVMNLLRLLPNFMLGREIDPPAMDYTYPQTPTHAIAQFMRLAEILVHSAATSPPLGGAPGLLLNDADAVVSNEVPEKIAAGWTAHGAEVDIEIIPQDRHFIHDLIDPRQPLADTDFIHPIVKDMISRRFDSPE